jgi:hypothetical protein
MSISKKMTVKEALEAGYKHYVYQYDESPLFDIQNFKPSSKNLVLCGKDKLPFTIDAKTIAELVDDYLCNQDDVNDEDGHLNELAAQVDYSLLADALNKQFEKQGGYYYPTGIILIP